MSEKRTEWLAVLIALCIAAGIVLVPLFLWMRAARVQRNAAVAAMMSAELARREAEAAMLRAQLLAAPESGERLDPKARLAIHLPDAAKASGILVLWNQVPVVSEPLMASTTFTVPAGNIVVQITWPDGKTERRELSLSPGEERELRFEQQR